MGTRRTPQHTDKRIYDGATHIGLAALKTNRAVACTSPTGAVLGLSLTAPHVVCNQVAAAMLYSHVRNYFVTCTSLTDCLVTYLCIVLTILRSYRAPTPTVGDLVAVDFYLLDTSCMAASSSAETQKSATKKYKIQYIVISNMT